MQVLTPPGIAPVLPGALAEAFCMAVTLSPGMAP